jgi:Major Facilitator Superfamily
MVLAGLLLVGGSLADRFGRKGFFLIGLSVFAAASVGAAFSGSVDLLIAWRAVMGAGAGLTIPASLSIINDVFRDPAERPAPLAPGPRRSGSASPSARFPAACCSPGSGGAQFSLSTSRSWPPDSQAYCCWYLTRRTRPPTGQIPAGHCCRSPGSACCCGRSSRVRLRAGPRVR